MQKTVEQIIVMAQHELSQVAGTGVQTYAEDPLANLIQQGFDFVYKEAWWSHLMRYEQRTLDGTVGIITTDLIHIKDYNDIHTIYVGNTDRKVTVMPSDVNPFRITGTQPRFMSALDAEPSVSSKRLVQFWPKTATGSVVIYGRMAVDEFIGTTIVPFDAHCIALYASWAYAENDGTNPGQIDKLWNLFDARLKQLKKQNSDKPIALDPSMSGHIPMEWSDVR
jgi:hypothetical protein